LKDIHQPSAISLKSASPERLVESRLDFAVRAALRVAARHEYADVELVDLIQEGNIALLEAVKERQWCPTIAWWEICGALIYR